MFRARRSLLVIILALMVSCLACFLPYSIAQEQLPAPSQRQIIKKTEPVYPSIALRARLKGSVRLQVKVTADGRPASIQVLGGNPLFAKAGVEAAEKWRWARAAGDTEELIHLTFDCP